MDWKCGYVGFSFLRWLHYSTEKRKVNEENFLKFPIIKNENHLASSKKVCYNKAVSVLERRQPMNRNKKISLSKYRVTPRTVPAGETSTVTICPMGEGLRFDDATEYLVRIVPMEAYPQTAILEKPIAFDRLSIYPKDGCLSVTYTFRQEQEWVISVTNEEREEKKKPPLEFRVYSLLPDLYERNPYRGDFHAHSTGSDGNEDPLIVAANYRKEGYDFFALTDHHAYDPSDRMVKAYEGVPCGLKMFRGEEVHLRGWIHIVNFGSRYSVNDLYHRDEERIHAELLAEAEKTETPENVNPLEYCYRKWIYDQIKKAGGMTILPHPHWIHKPGVHNMNTKMLEYSFRMGLQDAFELTGGQTVHENNLQIAFWQDMRAEGVKVPIVGSSDSHGTDPAMYFYMSKTVLFAKDMEFDSIRDAIKDGYSVAIEEQYGEQPHVHGPYRLVKYVRFLMDEYFPGHDELCVEEGRLMREFSLGDPDAKDALCALAGRTDRYRERTLRGR